MRIAFLLMPFFVGMSCQYSDTSQRALVEPEVAAELVAHVFSTEVEFINPFGLVTIDDTYLIVVDMDPRGSLKVFRLPDLNFLYAWGRQGRGPDEFADISSFTFFSDHHRRLIGVESGLAEIHHYQVTDTAIVLSYKQSLAYDMRPSPLNGVTRMHDSLYVVAYEWIDNTGREFVALRPDHPDTLFSYGSRPTTVSDVQNRMDYSSVGAAKPDGKQYAAFYAYQNMAKFFDDTGALMYEVRCTDPALKGMKDIFYTGTVGAYGEYLYAFSVDLPSDHFESMIPQLKPIVEVWDWSGHLRRKVRLDQPVLFFSVSARNGWLYGAPLLGGNELYAYDLAEIISDKGD